jgi:hypothetical protein
MMVGAMGMLFKKVYEVAGQRDKSLVFFLLEVTP